ncbi:hypothetical protein [Streptomyces sp. SID12501]|nr:hypothetical protein [Streptomyces sp. SID12501]
MTARWPIARPTESAAIRAAGYGIRLCAQLLVRATTSDVEQ